MSETSSEIAVLHAVLAAAEARTTAAERALTQSHAIILASDDMIRHLHLEIAKLRREQFGPSSERSTRLIEQLEMQLEDPETDIAADRCEAEAEAPRSVVDAFKRRRLSRKPFPEHPPRDRVVVEAPTSCTCSGSGRIVKMGEDINETLVPRQWKVIQTVREKFTAGIARKSANSPHHSTPRPGAGPARTCWPRSSSRSSANICP